MKKYIKTKWMWEWTKVAFMLIGFIYIVFVWLPSATISFWHFTHKDIESRIEGIEWALSSHDFYACSSSSNWRCEIKMSIEDRLQALEKSN